MKPEEQRIAIAEACGWLGIQDVGFQVSPLGTVFCGLKGFKKGWKYGDLPEDIPNYLVDLNAMSEAENIFNADASQRYEYAQLLEGICAQDRSESEYGRPIWKATSAQRAEAFLKTLNLWKD